MAAKQTMKENLQCTSKYGHLRISQDICHVRMTDIEGFLTIYGHSDNLLNNKGNYWEVLFFPRFSFHAISMVQFYLLPPPPGIPPGICNFFLTWRSIPHPRARRKRQFPTPGTPHRPPIRCFVAKPDVLARTSTIF